MDRQYQTRRELLEARRQDAIEVGKKWQLTSTMPTVQWTPPEQYYALSGLEDQHYQSPSKLRGRSRSVSETHESRLDVPWKSSGRSPTHPHERKRRQELPPKPNEVSPCANTVGSAYSKRFHIPYETLLIQVSPPSISKPKRSVSIMQQLLGVDRVCVCVCVCV